MSHPVRDSLRRLFGDSLVYGVSRAAGNLVGLILLPVYTHHMAVGEYGILDNLFVLSMLFSAAIPLGLPDALQRFWFLAKTDDERREVVGTALSGILVLILVAVPPLLLFAPGILEGLFDDATEVTAFRLVAVTLVPATLMTFGLAILRSRFRSAAYGVCSIVQVALLGGVNTWLVAGLKLGVTGVFLGGMIAAAATAGLALWFVRADLSLARSAKRLREMLAYGVPLVPSFLAFWALSYADRWLLLRISGAEEVGLYAAGAKVAGILLVLNFAALTAFNPVALRIAGQPEAKRFYAKSMTAYGAVAASVAVGLAALAPLAMRLLTPERYHDGHAAVPWLVVGFFLSGLTIFLSIGLHVLKKTHWITWIALIAAVANVGLNLWLIPILGMEGAALATAGAYALMAGLFGIVTNRLFPVSYEFGRLLRLSLLFGLALGVASGFEAWPIRLAVAAAFPPALVAVRVVTVREIRKLLRGRD
jgi:O-antigen/teichoic acid export membrane protein